MAVKLSAMWQPELESLDRAPLERLAVERMRATLARVLAEPAWARRLPGVRPEDIARVEDWRKLPFLTKEELRDAYPYGLACARPAGYRRIQMSSGTTGNPILNPYSASDVAQWGEVMARCYVAAGVGPTDVIQITPSFGLFTGGLALRPLAARLPAPRSACAGVHVWEAHSHPEIVDPGTGAIVPEGPEGELVISTLTREGLPLIRYRTHDLTRVVSRGRCDCGRTSLRLDRLRGRVDDMVIYKGVNFYPRQIETTLLRHSGVSHEYQIVLDSEGGGERMTIRVEAEPGCDPAVATRIRRELYDLLSLSPEVRLCTHGEIERPPGKAGRVVDRRPRR